MKIAATLLLLCAPLAGAQRILEERPGLRVVLDDDGGRVEVYRAGDAARNLEYHGGAVLHDPLIHAVFLGDWSKLDPVKGTLHGRAGAITGATDIPAAERINDLDVRRALAKLPLRDPNLVFVVFVAPRTEVTLGGTRDFDSYHSHFYADDAHVRYVVVPYRADVAATGDAAAESLKRALRNPDGDGWY